VLRRYLPWVAVLFALATAVMLLFGPLWADVTGENPLLRDPGPDYRAVLRLGLPTVVVAATLGVALALPARRWWAGVVLVLLAAVVLTAPEPLTLWFGPALVLTAAGWAAVSFGGGPG
jgi:hypothetical protein